jgi:TetR/AcrR family transcriptional repressor of nem operon
VGRPRGFEEAEVIESASRLFAERAYSGVSVDDLVTYLGVHRNSLYKTFGSKRGLYLVAFRWHMEHRLPALLSDIGSARDLDEAARYAVGDAAGASPLDLLLMAAIERAAEDTEVAAEVDRAFRALEDAIADIPAAQDSDGATRCRTAPDGVALLLGLRLRARTFGFTGG